MKFDELNVLHKHLKRTRKGKDLQPGFLSDTLKKNSRRIQILLQE